MHTCCSISEPTMRDWIVSWSMNVSNNIYSLFTFKHLLMHTIYCVLWIYTTNVSISFLFFIIKLRISVFFLTSTSIRYGVHVNLKSFSLRRNFFTTRNHYILLNFFLNSEIAWTFMRACCVSMIAITRNLIKSIIHTFYAGICFSFVKCQFIVWFSIDLNVLCDSATRTNGKKGNL